MLDLKSKINYKVLLTIIAITFAVSGLSGFLTSSSMEKYKGLIKPPLSPPSEVFGIVWPILYLLMAISLYIVLDSDISDDEKKSSILIYGVQLFVNFLWPIIYFNLEYRLFAFFTLVLLLVLVIAMTIRFFKINKYAGYLLIPYILWLIFAGYLNLATYLING